MVQNTLRQQQIQLVLVAISGADLSPQALREIVDSAGGTYRETPSQGLYEALQEVVQALE